MNLFDMQRAQIVVDQAGESLNALVVSSSVTCYIPEFRIAFPSVVNRTAITLTNPQCPKTPISENRGLSFTIVPDSENSSEYTDVLIENIGNKGVDSDLLVGLQSASIENNQSSDFVYNYLSINQASQTVSIIQNIGVYTFTGHETWTSPHSQMPGKNIILNPVIKDISTTPSSWPFCLLTHYQLDWMGDFGDGLTQGWDVWGQNQDGSLQLYIYNYNFADPQAYLDYLKTIYKAGQPMKLYYQCEPKTIDITNTQLAQELLTKVKPVQVAGARSVIAHDTSPYWIGGTCPIAATCVYKWSS